MKSYRKFILKIASMKTLFTPAILILFFSCKHAADRKVEKDSAKKDTSRVNVLAKSDGTIPCGDNYVSKDSNIIVYDCLPDDFNNSVPKNVMHSQFARSGLTIPLRFSLDSVMRIFFPGRYYRINRGKSICRNTDTTRMVSWRCKNCHFKQIPKFVYDDANDSTDIFPDSVGNETRLLDTIMWEQQDGKRYLLIAFSTSEITENFTPGLTGHYVCGDLGLALLLQEKNKWKLISFDPAITCLGDWQMATIPTVAITGKSSFIILVNHDDQGGGSPDWIYVQILIPDKNHFYFATQKLDWGIGNRPTDWTSEISRDSSTMNTGNHPDLKIVSFGSLFASDTSEIGNRYDNVPPAERDLKKYDSLDFVWTRYLHFSNGKYAIIKTDYKRK